MFDCREEDRSKMLAMLQRFEDGEEETDDSEDEEAGEVDLATRMKVCIGVWITKS